MPLLITPGLGCGSPTGAIHAASDSFRMMPSTRTCATTALRHSRPARDAHRCPTRKFPLFPNRLLGRPFLDELKDRIERNNAFNFSACPADNGQNIRSSAEPFEGKLEWLVGMEIIELRGREGSDRV